jgi:hypothetical protein
VRIRWHQRIHLPVKNLEVRAMIQRTGTYRAQAAVQSADSAFPFTFFVLAFGVIAGAAIAGIVVPIVVQTVVPAVVRAVIGA